jgi:ferredoxin, 2Fe-2S
MKKIHFHQADGSCQSVDLIPGLTVMEAAVQNLVPGIDGECGGACSCGTCHVWVDPEWASRLPAPSSIEGDLVSALDGATGRSRLCCQIKSTEAPDGLVLHVPARG